MKVAIFKSLWGMPGTLEQNVSQIAAAGYDGVEAAMNPEISETLPPLLAKHNLRLIVQMFTGGATVEDHIASFQKRLAEVVMFKPVKITVHSSRDKFSFEEQVRFYEAAMAAEAKSSVAVNHETHRGRALFTPWTTAALLKKFPALHLCADFSHWVCVCENLMQDQDDVIAQAIPRARHIHARVGFEEGPQVTDPAAPEFKGHLDRHLSWWDAILAAQKKAGVAEATITPEFGPPNYMHTLPYSRMPVADLWGVNLWMRNLLRERYKSL